MSVSMNVSSLFRQRYGLAGQYTAEEMSEVILPHHLTLAYNDSTDRITVLGSASMTRQRIEEIFGERDYWGRHPQVLGETDVSGNHMVRLIIDHTFSGDVHFVRHEGARARFHTTTTSTPSEETTGSMHLAAEPDPSSSHIPYEPIYGERVAQPMTPAIDYLYEPIYDERVALPMTPPERIRSVTTRTIRDLYLLSRGRGAGSLLNPKYS